VTWDDEMWEGFCALLDEGWPGEFDETARISWRVLLDTTPPDQAVAALRRLLLRGGRFRPSVSELLAETRSDPSMPTFDEAWLMIRRALRAPGFVTAARRRFSETGKAFMSPKDEAKLRAQAMEDAIAPTHPAVRRFVAVQGWGRLGEACDEEWGPARLKNLRDAWGEQAHATDGREIAVLASGGGRQGLRQLDPLAGIPQIGAGQTVQTTDLERTV
jgi:hypothetical protein